MSADLRNRDAADRAARIGLEQIRHRMEQMTRPTFDRGEMQSALDRIVVLENDARLTPEALGAAHNENDALKEAVLYWRELFTAVTAANEALKEELRVVRNYRGLGSQITNADEPLDAPKG
jgi:hypothetical protein